MEIKETIEALTVIAKRQQKTAPVQLQIGFVNSETQQCERDGVYIRDCPAAILSELQKHGFTMSMREGWLSVDKY